MAFLRLGVVCAVFDDDGNILLSRRGDFDIWNLPSGRLNAHEPLHVSAEREVQEETGVLVRVDKAIGMYYVDGWKRVNILFKARPIGGQLQQVTDESTSNQYFPVDEPPDNLFRPFLVADAQHGDAIIRMLETPAHIQRRVKLQLAWRWLKNLLMGRPEPRFPKFTVNAVLIVYDDLSDHILLDTQLDPPALPSILCDGKQAPHLQIQHDVEQHQPLSDAEIRWAGMYQQPLSNVIEFVFFTQIARTFAFSEQLQWYPVQNDSIARLDTLYIQNTLGESGIWSIIEGGDGYGNR